MTSSPFSPASLHDQALQAIAATPPPADVHFVRVGIEHADGTRVVVATRIGGSHWAVEGEAVLHEGDVSGKVGGLVTW